VAARRSASAHIAQAASVKGNRVLILVHRAELLDQASRAIPVPHGIIAANRAMDLSHTVQVASSANRSPQTTSAAEGVLPAIAGIIDEAHHTTAGTWARVIAHFSQAKLLGVTATPIRGDGRGLGEHYQAMVQGPTAQQLTDEGYLAPARVLAPPGFDSAGLRKRMGDFDTKQAEQRVGTIMGDCLGHYRKHLSGQTAIAFCCSVAHAEAVAHLFQSAGIAAASIDGSMDTGTRRELLQRLAVGDLKVLTSCALIGEGVDVPSVGGCILLRPTASVGLHLQMIGRCLRPQPGKTAVVLDHVGNTLRLGHHLEERDWTLDGLRKRDREAAPSVKVCPTCFRPASAPRRYAATAGMCLHHLSAGRSRQVEGELQELAIAARARKQEQGQAQSLQDLIALGHQRGYKNPVAWAKHLLAARQTKSQWSKIK
jgi:DNA repair protein RadD